MYFRILARRSTVQSEVVKALQQNYICVPYCIIHLRSCSVVVSVAYLLPNASSVISGSLTIVPNCRLSPSKTASAVTSVSLGTVSHCLHVTLTPWFYTMCHVFVIHNQIYHTYICMTEHESHCSLDRLPRIIVVRASAWGAGGRGSIPDRVTPKTLKMGGWRFALLSLALGIMS